MKRDRKVLLALKERLADVSPPREFGKDALADAKLLVLIALDEPPVHACCSCTEGGGSCCDEDETHEAHRTYWSVAWKVTGG